MKTTSLEKVIYFQDYVVTDPGDPQITKLKEGQLLTEEEYRQVREQYGESAFQAEMGAEAIRKLLVKMDLVTLSKQLREELTTTNSKQKKKDLINRLKDRRNHSRFRQQAGMDGAGRDSGHSARSAPTGAAG